MSHRFKSKQGIAYVHPRENRQNAELRRMARGILSQEHLDAIMLQVKPEMRDVCYLRVIAFVKFKARPDYRESEMAVKVTA